jgi:hypothetical protein
MELDLNTLPPAFANSIGVEFVLIPAGEFLMGSDEEKDPDAYDDETPHHLVSISKAFYAECLLLSLFWALRNEKSLPVPAFLSSFSVNSVAWSCIFAALALDILVLLFAERYAGAGRVLWGFRWPDSILKTADRETGTANGRERTGGGRHRVTTSRRDVS